MTTPTKLEDAIARVLKDSVGESEVVRRDVIAVCAAATSCATLERELDAYRSIAGRSAESLKSLYESLRRENEELRKRCRAFERAREIADKHLAANAAELSAELATLRSRCEAQTRRITVALELIAELRSYTKQWDYKYGSDWDTMWSEVAARSAAKEEK